MSEINYKAISTLLQTEGDILSPNIMVTRLVNNCKVNREDATLIYRDWRRKRMKEPLSSWFNKEEDHLLRKKKAKEELNKENLYYFYVNRKKSVSAIAKIFNTSCAKVTALLKEYNMPMRGIYAPEELLTKENLTELYVNQKLSMREIGDKIGCSEPVVKGRIRKHKIQR